MARTRGRRVVFPARTTKTVESTSELTMTGSMTARTGGVSRRTMLNLSLARARSYFIIFEFRSSAGFGGWGPLGIVQTLSMEVIWTTSSKEFLPAR